VVDRIRKVVENKCYLGPITLFLGAKTAFFGKGTKSMGHRAWRKGRRGEWFSRVRNRFNFESREFLI